MGLLKKLFGKREVIQQERYEPLEPDLPPLPDEAYTEKVSETCEFNTKTQQMKVSLPVHDIVLNLPVSAKSYASAACRVNRINKDTDFLNFTVFHAHRDGEPWMDYRLIEHITAIRFRDGSPVEAFDTDINTRRSNPQYGPKHPEAPTFAEVAGDFDRFVGDDTLVAFYLSDEAERLYYSGSRAAKGKGKKYEMHKEAYDLLELDNYRFDTVLEHYGINYSEDDLTGSTVAAGYLFMYLACDAIKYILNDPDGKRKRHTNRRYYAASRDDWDADDWYDDKPDSDNWY